MMIWHIRTFAMVNMMKQSNFNLFEVRAINWENYYCLNVFNNSFTFLL